MVVFYFLLHVRKLAVVYHCRGPFVPRQYPPSFDAMVSSFVMLLLVPFLLLLAFLFRAPFVPCPSLRYLSAVFFLRVLQLPCVNIVTFVFWLCVSVAVLFFPP